MFIKNGVKCLLKIQFSINTAFWDHIQVKYETIKRFLCRPFMFKFSIGSLYFIG